MADPGWICQRHGGVRMAGVVKGRVALVLEYHGGCYSGWQYQINADTVQNQVEKALTQLFSVRVPVRAASRTDAGVHARGQVAALDLPRAFPGNKLVSALNWHLPETIKIVQAYSVPQDFDPRRLAQGKIYRYFIFNRRQASALVAPHSWHVPQPLDIKRMNRAAEACLGTQDFASFQAAGSPVESTVRTLRHLYCQRRGSIIYITCVGNAFLYNMVRIITGTLVEVGLGRLASEGMPKILAAKSRIAAGPTAPAQGLFLERVLYRPSLDSYARL